VKREIMRKPTRKTKKAGTSTKAGTRRSTPPVRDTKDDVKGFLKFAPEYTRYTKASGRAAGEGRILERS